MGRRFWTVLAVAGAVAVPQSASAADDAFNSTGLRNAVTPEGIMEHEGAFQGIANANGGIRASGTPGYDASADYVQGKLEAAGYSVTRQAFPFAFFRQLANAEFQRISPDPRTYVLTSEFATMTYSGSGDVTATAQAVDVIVPAAPADNTSTSGCDSSDFNGFTAGNIAVVQRGTCNFAVKAANAQAAGASAVVVFNEGQPGRTDTIAGTLGAPNYTIPVIGTSYAIGAELVNLIRSGPVTLRVKTLTESEIRTTYNIIADTAGGRADRTIVVGAHLDSVIAGPGINDNGSGSSTILEIAEQFAERDIEPRNRVRFAWWGAEELNLLGSQYYVNNLPAAELANIAANLNFDMVGSPNYVRFVYDGDNSAFPVGPNAAAGPNGSGLIEAVFVEYFRNQGLASAPTPFSGRSDYGPFIARGIPAGGLFTGAEGIKTVSEAQIFGGTAGIAYDPNYHQAGDTIANVNVNAISEMSDAAAHATYTFARTRSEIRNGASLKPGKNGSPDASASRKAKRKARRVPSRGPLAVR